MRFSFRNCPLWFTNYVSATFLDEFHDYIKDKNLLFNFDQKPLLIDTAVEFFSQRGFCAYRVGLELWFDLPDDQNTTFLALRWSQE